MKANASYNLDTKLIDFGGTDGDWTIRNAVEGVQIFGGIGSGKTSGSGRMLALKYLENNFGGLVLTTKVEEKEMWEDYCRLANRSDDLIILEPGGEHRFNFLEYETSQEKNENKITDNIVQVLKTVIRASEEKSKGTSDDPFWEVALDMLIFNALDLCLLAYKKANIQMLHDVVQTIPKKSPEAQSSPRKAALNAFDKAYRFAQQKIVALGESYRNSLDEEGKKRVDENDSLEDELCEVNSEARLFKFIDQFIFETFKNISEKTRAIVEFTFIGFLFRLLKEPIYSMFCNGASTIKPEDCLEGKIILINLPIKVYHKAGHDCQILFKYIWQRAMEKRNIKENGRPVFLWADEAQNFLHEYDSLYQATARSSRIATVYISQNLPNYFANMGGPNSQYVVKSFLGTLATKIFHANADIDTNTYASDLIGEGYTEDFSRTDTMAGAFSSTKTASYKLEKMVRSGNFVGLKTGGPRNNYNVEGYIHCQGKEFINNQNFIKARFNQNDSL